MNTTNDLDQLSSVFANVDFLVSFLSLLFRVQPTPDSEDHYEVTLSSAEYPKEPLTLKFQIKFDHVIRSRPFTFTYVYFVLIESALVLFGFSLLYFAVSKFCKPAFYADRYSVPARLSQQYEALAKQLNVSEEPSLIEDHDDDDVIGRLASLKRILTQLSIVRAGGSRDKMRSIISNKNMRRQLAAMKSEIYFLSSTNLKKVEEKIRHDSSSLKLKRRRKRKRKRLLHKSHTFESVSSIKETEKETSENTSVALEQAEIS